MKLILFALLIIAPALHAQCVTPGLTSLTPAAGIITGGGTFTITGSDFCAGAVVDFGMQSAAVTTVTPTQIRGTIPPNPAGAAIVTVTNPGTTSVSFLNPFTYVNAAPFGLVANTGRTVFGSVGQALAFPSQISGGVLPYSYYWTFGDGTTGTTRTGTHTYARPGNYGVNFLVTDARGDIALSTTTAYITAPITNFLLDDKGNYLVDEHGNRLTAQ